ncbi:MAG TPA: DUF1059 domain-containing protein, partial [Gaiellaceae bacterium]|nr:DUF1059 domain-containing protein [Gaiellaceae bacterium]
RCDCGYEVDATDEVARVRQVRRHASEAHGIELSDGVARDIVRRGRRVSHGEHTNTTHEEER